ncbi:MAG: hypothetical protein R3A52_23940 [Polyangiales bacterium]
MRAAALALALSLCARESRADDLSSPENNLDVRIPPTGRPTACLLARLPRRASGTPGRSLRGRSWDRRGGSGANVEVVLRRALTADLDRYARGETAMNGVFVGVGALNLGAAAWMFADGNDFTRGMAWPFAVVGGVQATVGAVYLALTPGLRRRGLARLRTDPDGYRREEARGSRA